MLWARMTDEPATGYKLFGERCSGTNFIRALIDRNLPDLTFANSYNWEKHNFINPAYVKTTEVALVVIRSALDWFRSLYRNPHQVGLWYQSVDFSEFLRHEWSSIINGELIEGQELLDIRHRELMFDRHPVTGGRIANVVELRNLKVQSQLKVRHLYENWMIVSYEEARDDPEDFIAELARLAGLRPCDEFVPVHENMTMFSGAGREHLPYPEYCRNDLRFLANALDLRQEHEVGFEYPQLHVPGDWSVADFAPAVRCS